MPEQRSAIIIGGGIIGVTGAYALAREGWRVQLVEAYGDVALGASLGNGRQLSYSHTNALAHPSILREIPRLVLGRDEAFRIRLTLDPHFLGWVLRFLTQCTTRRNRANTLAGLALAEESRRAMDVLQERHPFPFDRRASGKFVLLRGEGAVAGARASIAAKRAAGLDQRLLTPQEAFAIEPALANSAEPIAAAIYTSSDESGDCRAFASGLARVLGEEYGVEIRCNAQALRLERRGGRSVVTLADGEELSADLAVVSSGYRSNALLAPLGISLPIEPMKGYSFTAPLGNAAPLASVTDAARRIVFTHLGDRMLVAGIAEMGRVDGALDKARLASMIASARASLPEAAVYGEASAGWTGMRPMTPDSLPITQMLAPGIAANTGHGMLGWTMAMGSAGRLASVVRAAT